MPSVNARTRWARLAFLAGCYVCTDATMAGAQSLSLNLGTSGSQSLATNLVSIMALTSVLAIAPGILVMGTAFTRIV
ncbi:MAG TPA: flagellar biosynthetic protein FliP, partial [Rhodopila sp.]|nr:flagellar biosynthetic protein FliP [Rhodopila sp.]